MKKRQRYPDAPVTPMTGEPRKLCLTLSQEVAADADALPAVLENAKAQGFTTVKLTCAWYLAERAPLHYSFGYYDRRLALIRDAGMDVLLCIDLRRTTHIFDGERVCTDMVITTDEFFHGNGARQPWAGSGDGEPICITLASSKATGMAVRFFRDAVHHFYESFGDAIYAVLPVFSPEGNSEYPADAMDTSIPMLRAYRSMLPLIFRTTAEMNLDLQTRFPAFGAAELPAPEDRGPAGKLYYRCRHRLLLDFIQRLAGAKQLAAPELRFALQFGSVTDASAAMRCTLGFGALGACAALVLIGEAPAQDIAFSADYAASTFAGTPTRFGICGPHLALGDAADCAAQGITAFLHNAAIVCIDRPREDNAAAQIADTCIRASDFVGLSENMRQEQPLKLQLSRYFETGSACYYTGYYQLYTEDGRQFGRICAEDDLTECMLPHSIAGTRDRLQREEALALSRRFRKRIRTAAGIAAGVFAVALMLYWNGEDEE